MISNSYMAKSGGLLTFEHGMHILINILIGLSAAVRGLPGRIPTGTGRSAMETDIAFCRAGSAPENAREGVPVGKYECICNRSARRAERRNDGTNQR